MLTNATTARLPSLTLAEVQDVADLQTRTDRKYIIDADTLDHLFESLAHDVAILDIDGRRQFAYESVYFDTPGLDLYRAAAYRRRRRYKVRTRVYDDSGLSMLEVKTKDGRGNTVKSRMDYDRADQHRLTDEARRFIDDVTGRDDASAELRPALTTRYRRATIIDGNTRTRATVDCDVVCTDTHGRSLSIDQLILETKSRQAASPIDRALWRLGVRPVTFSKCCTAQAVIDPSLPSNKWRRTIRRHLQ